jgi:sulfate transport system ATP-binding protein
VELPRAEYLALREQLKLEPGTQAWLLPRRVTRFAVTPPQPEDPAAMI